MHRNKKAGKRSRKLLKWIQRYGGYWQLICTPGCDLDMAVTRNIIHSLAKSGLARIYLRIADRPQGEGIPKEPVLISEPGSDAGRDRAPGYGRNRPDAG